METIRFSSNGGYSYNFNASSKCNFFSEPVLVKEDDGKLIFTHPSIDYQGKVHNPIFAQNKWKFGVTSENLQNGLYEFDYDENMDEIIVAL